MKVKVSDSLDNVPNENIVTQLVTNQPTDCKLRLLSHSPNESKTRIRSRTLLRFYGDTEYEYE